MESLWVTPRLMVYVVWNVLMVISDFVNQTEHYSKLLWRSNVVLSLFCQSSQADRAP